MGNSCFSISSNARRMKENGKHLDQQLRTVHREDKPQEQDFIALIVYKETLPYCEKIINFLFEYHLSLRTLHFYILSQIKRLVFLTNKIHKYCTDIKLNKYNYNDDKYKQSYRIRCEHSCNIIMNQLTEDSPITNEIGKRIRTLFNDRGVSNTFNLIKSILIEDNCNKKITDNNEDQIKIEQKMTDLISTTKIDTEFCDYFINNILDYCETRSHRHKSSNDDWDWNYYYHRHHLGVNWTSKSDKYNHMYKYDCQLLKKHIIMENKGQPLCYSGNYRHIYFLLGNETQITLFNIDDPKCKTDLSNLRWYRQVIINSFDTIIFCLPLSWFYKIRHYNNDGKNSTIEVPPNDESCQHFVELMGFYRKIIIYDNERHKKCEEYLKNIPKVALHPGESEFTAGLRKQEKTMKYKRNFIIPAKTFWIIPDFENFVNFKYSGNNSSKFNTTSNNNNNNNGVDYNDKLNTKIHRLEEEKLIDHLLNWRNKRLKQLNKQIKTFYRYHYQDLQTNIMKNMNYYKIVVDSEIAHVPIYKQDEYERIIRYTKFSSAKSKFNIEMKSHISSFNHYFNNCDDENVYYKHCLNYDKPMSWDIWHTCKENTFIKLFKKYKRLTEYLDPFASNRYGANVDTERDDEDIVSFMTNDEWLRYIYITDGNSSIIGDRDKQLAYLRYNKYDLCPMEYRNQYDDDYINWYWVSNYDRNSDRLMVDIFREMSQPNEYYRVFLNYPPFYSISSIGRRRRQAENHPQTHIDDAFENIFNIFNFGDRYHGPDYPHRRPIADRGFDNRFCDLQSFKYNETIETLFEFSENIIECCLTSFIDNGNRDNGRCIERVVNFGYFDRLMNILNNKELFDKVKIYAKHKKIESLGCASVTDLNLFDEFDYDHYVRIAFQDWNLSIIGLIAKSTKCRGRYLVIVNRYKFGGVLPS